MKCNTLSLPGEHQQNLLAFAVHAHHMYFMYLWQTANGILDVEHR